MSNAPQNTSYQALYRACMKEAAAQGRTLMQRLVARAGETMPRRAGIVSDERERRLLAESAHTLAKHEGALSEAYPQALLAEFAQAIAGDTRKSGPVSFDSLELMGDDQMQESVELMRLQQIVVSQVDAEITELGALVCAVQGLKSVQADRNPLRPEVYVRSLRSVVMESPVPTAVRARWMHYLGEAMGPELARVYRELSALLRAQGVVEARFNAAPMPESDAQIAARAVPAAGSAHAGHHSLNLKELRSLLSGEFDATSAASVNNVDAPDFSMTVPAAFEALQEMKQVDQVMKRLAQRRAEGTPDEERSPAQTLGMEVVNLMVENIASDSRLLAPVQQTVRDLEPALLRLALDDPRFFSDRKHPARRLLEQMTQRSLAWQAVDAPGFAAFIEPLQQAVEVLLSTRIPGAEPFDFALKTLEEAWGDQQKRDRRYREKAVRALLQAEQRNLLAEKVAKDLRARVDVAGAPRELNAFLTGPWAQVMAQARLTDQTGVTDPGGYAGLVSDMVWSAQPRMAAFNSDRLARLAPEIMEKLRHGLATIDYPAPSTQRFVDYLGSAHRQGLKVAELAPSSGASTEELAALLAGEEEESSGPWLAPTEAQYSGFMETHQSITPKPLFQETQAGFGDTRPGAGDLAPALPEGGLQPGAWVEMMIEGGWARYQVTWASPHGTLFMFSSAAGKPHSMTRRLLGKMLQGGTMKMISGQAVVDGALDAVAQLALRNSLDLTL